MAGGASGCLPKMTSPVDPFKDIQSPSPRVLPCVNMVCTKPHVMTGIQENWPHESKIQCSKMQNHFCMLLIQKQLDEILDKIKMEQTKL